MVAPVNSNRLAHIPQITAKQEVDAAPRGKSEMSIGHQAKAMLSEGTGPAGLQINGPNKMGKLASMLAQTKFETEPSPDVPSDPVIVDDPEIVTDVGPIVPIETPVELAEITAEADDVGVELISEIVDSSEDGSEETSAAPIVEVAEPDETDNVT